MERRLLRTRHFPGIVAALALFMLATASCNSTASGSPERSIPNAPGSPAIAPPVLSADDHSATSAVVEPTGTPGAITPPAEPAHLELSLQPSDQALLTYAESVLTQRCMDAQGFVFQALSYPDLLQTNERAERIRALAQFPYDAAVEGVPYADTSEQLPIDPNEEYIRSLSESSRGTYGDALQGDITDRVEVSILGNIAATPKAGCVSEARTELYGSLEAALTVLIFAGNINPTSHTLARTEAEVSASLAAWANCMKSAGYALTMYTDARAFASSNPTNAVVIAEADRRCTDASNLGDIYRKAYADAYTKVLNDNAAQVETVTAARSDAIRQAQDLLANATTG